VVRVNYAKEVAGPYLEFRVSWPVRSLYRASKQNSRMEEEICRHGYLPQAQGKAGTARSEATAFLCGHEEACVQPSLSAISATRS